MIVVETGTMNTAMVGALRARRFDLTRGPRVIAGAGTLEVAGVDILTGGGVLRAESGSWCQLESCIAYLMGAHVRPSVESMMT